MPSPAFQEPPAPVPPTPKARVDELVARVASKKDAWLVVGIAQRLDYLRRAIEGVIRDAIHEALTELSADAIGD